MSIGVSIVEDNRLLATELEKCIARTAGFECTGVFSTAEEVLQVLPGDPPDVLVVDLRLPGMSGVELIRRLKMVCPELQCLVLTMYAESDLIFEALSAGACGYLLKRTKPAEIAAAIRQIHAGGSVMTPRIARRVLELFANLRPNDAVPSDLAQLTDREKSVLQSMVEGHTRKKIASDLDINPHTLNYVVRCIYRKLHVNSVAAAVSTALREGMVSPKKRLPSAP